MSRIRTNVITNRMANGAPTVSNGLVISGVTTSSSINIADSIVHTGDTNTAIKFPANDTISFETSGNERLRITSAGNLALGNDGSFPIYAGANDRNFIIGTGSDDAAVNLYSGTTKFGGIYFGDGTSGGDRYVGYVEYKHDDDYLRIATNGAEKLRINSAGALITNTTGTLIAKFNSSNSAGSYLEFAMGASGANIGYMGSADQLISGAAIADLAIRSTQNFAISTGGASERFRISSTGQIICNTTQTVSAEFNTSSGAGSYLQFDMGASGANIGYMGAGSQLVTGSATADLGIRSAANLVFSTGGSTERLRIDSSGKIGMGSQTNPQGQLDIRTTDDDDAIRLVNTSTGNNGIQWWNEYGGLTKRVSMDYGEGDANFDIKCFRGDAQTDRPYGNVRIMTGSYSNPNMNFRVTTLGSVHHPNQPGFHVYTVSGTQSQVLTFGNTHHNIGNHMNLSNGRFTAPISGRYLFTFAFLHSNSPTSYARVLFQLNGTRSTQYGDTLCDDTGLYVNTSMSMIFNLSANDTVELYNEGNNIYGSQYGAFSGILLA